MNPESSLNCYKEVSSPQKQTAGFLPSVLCFFFPYNFLILLSEITFLLSPPHSNDPLFWLRGAVGSEKKLGSRQEEEKTRASVVGNNVLVVASA